MTTLAELTTLRVGGPAARFEEAATEAELIEAVRGADADGVPLLVIGGGSNLLVGDAGFDGLVLRDARRDVRIQDDGFCGGVSVTATAGTVWDAVVERAVAEGITLLERRNAFEFMRDYAADLFEAETGSAWRPRTGSKVNHANMTAAMIDSRDFLSARRHAETEVLIPAGPRIAFTGGPPCNASASPHNTAPTRD